MERELRDRSKIHRGAVSTSYHRLARAAQWFRNVARIHAFYFHPFNFRRLSNWQKINFNGENFQIYGTGQWTPLYCSSSKETKVM